ncbi:MAG TPA: hypothetical protein PKZ76_01290 [Xanthomonadaceae bacterium]|nr:hypothetical protein [Xanthomonadaceae bacterium]
MHVPIPPLFRQLLFAGLLLACGPASAAGQLDTTFGSGGRVVFDFHQQISFHDIAFALAPAPDGRLVLAGIAQSAYGNSIALLRLDARGRIDRSFGTEGSLVIHDPSTSPLYALGAAVQDDGRIVLAATRVLSGSVYQWWVLRVLADGSGLDPSFGSVGAVRIANHWARSIGLDIALQPDGRILALGTVFDGGIDQRMAVARLMPNGVFDSDFAGGSGFFEEVFDPGHTDVFAETLLRQTDGRILVAGRARKLTGDGDLDMALLRLLSNGTPDSGFGFMTLPGRTTVDFSAVGLRTNDRALALAYRAPFLDPGARRILVGGVAEPQSGGLSKPVLAALNYDGSLATGFGSGGRLQLSVGSFNDYDIGVHALALERLDPLSLETADHILIGGTQAAPTGLGCFAWRVDFSGAPDGNFNGGAVRHLHASPGSSDTCFAGIRRGDRFLLAGANHAFQSMSGLDFLAFAVLAGNQVFRDGFEGTY